MRRRGGYLSLLAAVLCAAAAGCGGAGEQTGGEKSSATPAASRSSSAPETTDAGGLGHVEEVGGLRFEGTPQPDWAAAAGGVVWVAGVGAGVGWYDGATGRFDRGLPVLSVCSAMDVAFGSVWVPSCSPASLTRIDPESRKVIATIKLPAEYLAEESSVAAGEGAVWLLDDSARPKLLHVDPRSNKVLGKVAAPAGAAALRAGLGGLWVTVYDPGRLLRLDPRTGRKVATIDVGEGARFLALGPDAVWVMNQTDGSVSRVDPRTGKVVATIEVSSQPIQGGDIAASSDAVWVRTEEALAVRIDPATNEVTQRVGPAAGSGGVAIAEDAVWFTAHDVGAVWRLPKQ